jgi:hypothetical protein
MVQILVMRITCPKHLVEGVAAVEGVGAMELRPAVNNSPVPVMVP